MELKHSKCLKESRGKFDLIKCDVIFSVEKIMSDSRKEIKVWNIKPIGHSEYLLSIIKFS